jgi:hypothetical protein
MLSQSPVWLRYQRYPRLRRSATMLPLSIFLPLFLRDYDIPSYRVIARDKVSLSPRWLKGDFGAVWPSRAMRLRPTLLIPVSPLMR